jgi:sugar/nucleoside kinase (ribokinase family)
MPYDPTQQEPRDRARFLLADTNDAAPLRTDEEYDAVLARHTDFRAAVIELALSLMAEAGQKLASFAEAGGVSLDWRDRLPGWRETVRSLQAELAREAASASVVTGYGASQAVRGDRETDTEYGNPVLQAPWGD